MAHLLRDLQYALRTFRANPGFTAVAVIALALGIGANTAIFSVVHGVLLRPLPYAEPESLVAVNNVFAPGGKTQQAPLSAPDVLDYARMTDVFEQVAAIRQIDLNLLAGGTPERLPAARVSTSFFDLLRVRPVLGRGFERREGESGRDKVAVLTHGLWTRRFSANPSILGRDITLNGEKYTVIGVTGPEFQFNRRVELYVPLSFTPAELRPVDRGNLRFNTVARVQAGVSLATARSRVEAFARRLPDQFPDSYPRENFRVELTPLNEALVKDVRPTLLVLLTAVGFVLLIACVNVANLMLVRGAGRQRELAVRTALGAGRKRLIQQLLTESVLLSMFGGAAGVLVALWGVDALRSVETAPLPRAADIRLDGTVLLFTLAVSFAVGIVFGLVPVLHASSSDLNDALKEGGRSGSAGRSRQRLNRILVVAEVALALVLLVGAGLMIRSLNRLQSADLGFDRSNVLTARVALPDSAYNGTQAAQFFLAAVERVSQIAGVRNAGATSILPLTRMDSVETFELEGRPTPRGAYGPSGAIRVVTPGYLEAMRIPLRKGRLITHADHATAPSVALIDETLARTYWPNEDPVGKRITYEESKLVTIVGVVGFTHHRDVTADPRGTVYRPLAQAPVRSMTLAVRTDGDPLAVAGAVRNVVRSLDRNQPIYDVMTMEQRLAEVLAPRRYAVVLLSIFAGVAIILASVGIYGVIAYSVSQRRHEIGIRLALGAARTEVVGMVVRQAMVLASAGLVLGFAAALGATRALGNLIHGVNASDPPTYASVAVLLASVALIAAYVPARRASRVDPINALRYE